LGCHTDAPGRTRNAEAARSPEPESDVVFPGDTGPAFLVISDLWGAAPNDIWREQLCGLGESNSHNRKITRT
jgi:hypothetical protein